MKTKITLLCLILSGFLAAHRATAQGTSAFTYQGQLMASGTNVNGNRTLIFRLFDSPAGGNQIGAALTNSVGLSNGLFLTTLDFGAGAFNGSARWLELTVGDGFTLQTLAPRVQTLATPYAQFAATAQTLANGANLSGTTLTNNNGVNLTNVQFSNITGVGSGFVQTTNGSATSLNVNGLSFGGPNGGSYSSANSAFTVTVNAVHPAYIDNPIYVQNTDPYAFSTYVVNNWNSYYGLAMGYGGPDCGTVPYENACFFALNPNYGAPVNPFVSPDWAFFDEGSYSYLGDSGYGHHSWLKHYGASLDTDILGYGFNDTQGPILLHLDALHGIMGLTTTGTNFHAGPGNISAASGVITGVGTTFGTTVKVGDILVNSANYGALVTSIVSPTSATAVGMDWLDGDGSPSFPSSTYIFRPLALPIWGRWGIPLIS